MRLAKTTIALAAGLLVAGTGLPQQPPGGGGGFGGFGGGGGLANSIARSKPLQDELKMDAAQVEKLTAALTKAREETRELSQKLFSPGLSVEERTETTKKIQDINAKALESALKPEQVKRFHQLENQAAGLGVFNRQEVAKALNLTDEQKEKLTAISREFNNDRRELMVGGGGRRPGAGGPGGGGFGRLDPEVQKKLDTLQKEAVANSVKVLTDEQQKTYKDLTGEPADLPPGTLGFGGFGGFGGGGFAGPGGGFGQPGGGFGGPGGGFGGFGGGGQPGTVLSTNVQSQLKLTDEQKKELEQIQKDVDAKLEKLFTEEQRKQFKEMRDRQPGRPGRQPKKDD